MIPDRPIRFTIIVCVSPIDLDLADYNSSFAELTYIHHHCTWKEEVVSIMEL